MTRPGIEPRPPGPLANTLPARPMSRLAINKASLILRFPTLRTIAYLLTEKLSSLFLHLIKYLWNDDARVLRCSLILMWMGLIVLPI